MTATMPMILPVIFIQMLCMTLSFSLFIIPPGETKACGYCPAPPCI